MIICSFMMVIPTSLLSLEALVGTIPYTQLFLIQDRWVFKAKN